MPTAPQSFGHRAQTAPRAAAPVAKLPAPPVPIAAPAPDLDIAYPAAHEISLDQELREWKKTRRFQIPWRPLWWMASASFGIGSLVLPDSVNDSVDWLLYALMAASFCAGFMKRREAKDAR